VVIGKHIEHIDRTERVLLCFSQDNSDRGIGSNTGNVISQYTNHSLRGSVC